MKSLKVLGLGVCALLLSGCVKMNVDMSINKDKSMDFSMLMAVNKEYMSGSEGIVDDEEINKMKEEGFDVSEYNENDMMGYKISKKVDNIDKLSTTEDVEFKFSDLSEGFDDDAYMFKIKKGLFKNTYTAKFTDIKMSSDMGDFNTGNNNSFENDDNLYNDDNIYGSDYSDWGNDDDSWMDGLMLDPDVNYPMVPLANGDDMDFSDMAGMMSSMEANFIVKLPYAAKMTNATGLNNDGKELSWNLMSNNLDYISFEFELYNMPVIYGTIGIVVVVIGFLIFSVLRKRKGPKAGEVVLNNPVVNNDALVGQSLDGLVEPQSVPNVDPSPIVGASIDMMGTNVNDGLINNSVMMPNEEIISQNVNPEVVNPIPSNEIVNQVSNAEGINQPPMMDLSMPSDIGVAPVNNEMFGTESVDLSLNGQVVLENSGNVSVQNLEMSVESQASEPVNMSMNESDATVNAGFEPIVSSPVAVADDLGVSNEASTAPVVEQPKPVQQSMLFEIEDTKPSDDSQNNNGNLM